MNFRILVRLVIIALVTILMNNSLKATHMMGSDISYICISPGKYLIIAKVYRDCRGVALSSPAIKAFSENCASDVSISYTRTAINDISPKCIGTAGPCGSPNTPFSSKGIEEHVFEGIVDFNTAPFNTFVQNKCCQVYFSVEQCCRNNALSTLNPGNLFTEAMIDLCNIKGKCNTSPQLTIPPVAYICCNLPFTFNNGASEIIDGDSLAYSLANPLKGHNNNEDYQGSFTPTIPMTPFCIPPGVINCKPLPNAKPPRGFYFDNNSGDLIFTPTNCSEAGVIVIQIDEYRKDSSTGGYLLIGRTRRDMQLWVEKCADNNPPTIPTKNKWTVCEGKKLCFTIVSQDLRTVTATRDDTTQLSWNFGIPGATFKIIDPNAREKQAEFCWQTKVGDAREFAYQFTVTAVDDNCLPAPARINKGFLVTVKPKAETKRKYDILDCGKLRFKSNPKDTVNFKGTYTYEWTIRDSTNAGFPYYKGFKQMDSIKFKRGGKYIITHTINNVPINCETTYIDTVIMPPVLDVELAFGRDTFVCAGDSLVVKPIIAYGYQPFKYHWESPTGTFKAKDTLDRFAIKPIANTTIMLKITDKNKCVDTDTIKIKYQPLPVVNIGPDRRICTYDNITLDAQNDDTMRYFWQPDGDSTRLKTINVAGKYWVKVIDHLGCNKSDTMELYVNDTVVAIAKPDREICINDTLKVKASRRPLGYTRTMSWTDLNTGIKLSSDSSFIQKITQIVPRSYDLFLKVTQGTLAKGGVITCEDHDTLLLTVNPLPILNFNGFDPRCYTDGAINLTLKEVATATDQLKKVHKDLRYFQKYKKPSWVTGGPVGTAPFIYDYPKFITNAQIPAAGLRDTICYDFRDFKGCYNYDCKPIRLNPNPDVKVKDGMFCQRAGLISLDKLAVIPFNKVGGIQSWRVLEVPVTSGVDPLSIISSNTAFPPQYFMDPGIEGENNKTGDYKVEYCFKNPSTGCQRCDTTTVTVVRLPEIQFDPIPSQCINYPLLALDSFVVEKNSGKRFPSGTWECVAYGGSRDMNIPPIKNAINNSVKSKKYFDPATDQNGGQYLLKFTDVASGCPVTDSTEITVNGLPQIKLPRADTLCSSAGLFQLTSNYPVGDVNGKWSEPASQTTQYVSGSNFDPSKSPKTTQYEGPVKLYYSYTNPLTKCSNIDSAYKTIQSQPEALINNTKPYQQCEDQLYNMDATTKWAKYRTWTSSGDGLFSTSDTMLKPSYKGGVLDTMNGGTVILTVTTNKEGVCPQASDNITLILEPYPQFRLPIHFVQCEPATIDFTSYVSKPNGSANLRYSWYFGNGDSLSRSTNGNPQGIKYPVTKEGWYDLRLTVHNQWGAASGEVCSITIDSIDYIRVLPRPQANFEMNPANGFTTVAFPKFNFYNTTSIKWGKVDYLWSFNYGVENDDTSTIVSPLHNYPADTTKYLVNLNAKYWYYKHLDQDMESDTDMYCSSDLSKEVKIGPDVTVFVPTAFSPEGTGPRTNNVFNAVVNGEKTFHIEVYSRWGERLWESDNKYETWNGKFQTENCQQDVYVWVVKVTDYKNEEYRYEGTVTLLR